MSIDKFYIKQYPPYMLLMTFINGLAIIISPVFRGSIICCCVAICQTGKRGGELRKRALTAQQHWDCYLKKTLKTRQIKVNLIDSLWGGGGKLVHRLEKNKRGKIVSYLISELYITAKDEFLFSRGEMGVHACRQGFEWKWLGYIIPK